MGTSMFAAYLGTRPTTQHLVLKGDQAKMTRNKPVNTCSRPHPATEPYSWLPDGSANKLEMREPEGVARKEKGQITISSLIWVSARSRPRAPTPPLAMIASTPTERSLPESEILDRPY